MALPLAAARPPAKKPVAEQPAAATKPEETKFLARNFSLHGFAGTQLALGSAGQNLGLGVGALADLQFEFLHRYVQPYLALAFARSVGKDFVDSMIFYTAAGGLGSRLALPGAKSDRFLLSLHVAGGLTFGALQSRPAGAPETFDYNVPTLAAGATLDAFLTQRVALAVTLRGHYLMDTELPMPIFAALVGVGYKL